MNSALRCTLVALCVGFVTINASAQEKAPGLATADTNGDQQITFEELKAARPELTQDAFNRRDKNGDGVLTDADKKSAEKPDMKAARNGESGAAPKGERRGEPGQLFVRADADKDGKVSLAEVHGLAPNFPEERFKAMDKNSDGVIERSEIGQAAGDRRGPGQGQGPGLLFERGDANKDGKITFEEVAALDAKFPEERFKQFDASSDGSVTQEEFRQFGARRMEMMRQADTNGDRQITLEEMTAADPKFSQEQFARLDVNGDGVLTPDDRRVEGPGRKPEGREPKGAMASGNETKYGMLAQLMAADSNSDGKTTFAEVETSKPGFPQEVFKRYDTDGDGAISQTDR